MPEDLTELAEQTESQPGGRGGSRYPPEAFEVVSEGLSYAIQNIHGADTPAHQFLARFMAKENLDWADLAAMYETGRLPGPLATAVEDIGGADKLNRHISGRELCWGLREFALKRWGLLTRTVLARWNIHESIDFGRIVFETIERGHMQKQPGDSLRDFEDVYDFSEAFDEVFHFDANESHEEKPSAE